MPWSRGHGILGALCGGVGAGIVGSPSFSFSDPIVGLEALSKNSLDVLESRSSIFQ